MTQLLKDAISLLFFIFFCLFRRNKKAVLVYHSIGDIPKSSDPLKMNVPPALFEKHMAYISNNKENFLITFDDGYQNIFPNAVPILKRYRLKSVVFVTTYYIDGNAPFCHFFGNAISPKPLSWDMIREMASHGIEIGCHASSHKNLALLNKDEAYSSIKMSKKRIEDMTGKPVKSFSYPFGGRGSYNKDTGSILKNLGFEKAYINIMGMDNSGRDPMEIKRIRIYTNDNMLRFKMKIKGAYNWVDSIASFMPKNRKISSHQ